MLVHNIDPILVKIGPLTIRYYGVLYAAGIISAYFICRSFFRKRKYPDQTFDRLIIYLVIGLILGAHYVHILFYEPASIINNPIRLLEIGTGLASHGGFLGALLALYLFTRKRKLNFFEYTDVITVGGSLMVPFIRLGNFFNSEIYGRVTDSPLGIIFKQRGETLPRHPSQLYEMLVGIMIFVFIYYYYKKFQTRVKEGAIFFLFIILYFTTRFLLEFVKEYQALSASFPFTMGQLLSLPFVLIGVIIFIKGKYYKLKPEEIKA